MRNLNAEFAGGARDFEVSPAQFHVRLPFSVEDDHYGKAFPVSGYIQSDQVCLSGISTYSGQVSLPRLVGDWEQQIGDVNRDFASDRRNGALAQARGRRINSIYEMACELSETLHRLTADCNHPRLNVILESLELLKPFTRQNGDIYHKKSASRGVFQWPAWSFSPMGLGGR